MSYKFSFADNGVYGADDINKITKRLVTSGVEDSFENGVPYNLSALNEAGTLLYTNGVVPETVSTLKVVTGSGENTILINPGTAFFNDGSIIEIEVGGHELSFTAGVKNYVYLKNDLISKNASYPECSVYAPSGDFVLLAEIEEDGTIKDKRTYAMGKLPGYQSNQGYPFKIKDTLTLKKQSNGLYGATVSYNIGNNAYNYIFTSRKGTDFYDNGTTYHIHTLTGVYDIVNSKYLSFFNTSYLTPIVTKSFFVLYTQDTGYAKATISIDEGVLTLNVESQGNISVVPIDIYLF